MQLATNGLQATLTIGTRRRSACEYKSHTVAVGRERTPLLAE